MYPLRITSPARRIELDFLLARLNHQGHVEAQNVQKIQNLL